MSYLFVLIIGTIAGWVAGQYLKGSEMGVMPDLVAGAVGGTVAVLISRLVGPEATSGFLVSAVVAIIGALGTLYAMRHVLKEAPAKTTRPRRR